MEGLKFESCEGSVGTGLPNISSTERTEGLVLATGGPGQGIGVVALRKPATAPVRTRIMVENSRTTVLPHHAVPNQGHAPLPTATMLDPSPWMHTRDPPPGHPDLETAALAPRPPGKMGVATAQTAASWMTGRSKGVDSLRRGRQALELLIDNHTVGKNYFFIISWLNNNLDFTFTMIEVGQL